VLRFDVFFSLFLFCTLSTNKIIIITSEHSGVETNDYCGDELVRDDVFSAGKKTAELTISSPLELSAISSSNERLITSPAGAAGTKPSADVVTVSPTLAQHSGICELVSPPVTSNVEHQVPTHSPECRHVPQRPQQISNAHRGLAYISASWQSAYSPRDDVDQTSRAVRGTSQNRTVSIVDEPLHHGIHQPDSPPFTSNVESQLQSNSPQHRHLLRYPLQVSDARPGAAYRTPPQQPLHSPRDDIAQMPQAFRGSSPDRAVTDADELKHHRMSRLDSPPFSNNTDCLLPSDSPQRQHLPQYPQQISNSCTGSTNIPAPQQPVYSSRSDVGQMPQAVRGISPHRTVHGTDENGYSRIPQQTAPIRPFTPAGEQHPYIRPSANQKHIAAVYLYSQPAGNHDWYRNRNATPVSQGLDPYRQQIPSVTESRRGLSTSDLDGMHQQRTASRSSSCREQQPSAGQEIVQKSKPAVQAQRSSSQRDMFAVGREQGRYVERIPLSGNGPSPQQQNLLMNDPYRIQYLLADRANPVQHDRLVSRPVLSRDLNMDRPWANDSAAARVLALPALHRPGPTASAPSQYSGPACRGQQNNDRYRYPSPAYFVDSSLSPRPLPPAEYQQDNLRNAAIELQHLRARQVCTESSIVSWLSSVWFSSVINTSAKIVTFNMQQSYPEYRE